MKARIVDEVISQARLEAARDLEIRVAAPFTVRVSEDELVTV
jgi:hypothetical protein